MSNVVLTPLARRSTPDLFRLAAIDVGSNSIHMVIGQTDAEGVLTTLWRMKQPVGLGRLSFPSRKLSRQAMNHAVETLGRFKQAAQQRQCETIRAVATSAVREAENGGDLIERCRDELDMTVRVVSPKEEARLIYLGVRHMVPLKGAHLIVDIGGGSVEFIVGDSKQASLLESRKLGAARMTAQFVKSDPIDKKSLEAMRAHYAQELAPICERVKALGPVKFLGSSGTLENIAAMCGDAKAGTNGHSRSVIQRSDFDTMLEKLLRSDSPQRAKMPGLDDQRRDQILAGAVMVDEIFKQFRFQRIELAGGALREGILVDYLAQHLPSLEIRSKVPDPRRRSVLDLAHRCDWHKTHSEHVARLTLQMFDQLRALHGLNPVARELIEYAALLHDIGWHISRNSHHKHSMYLILNGELKGFSPEEISIMGNIARYHRKTIPTRDHAAFDALSKSSRQIVNVGAALLRLADGLDRSHVGAIRHINCHRTSRGRRCELESRSDAQLELWGARRKRDLYEKVFSEKIEFVLVK